ncbi:MAG: glycosyltransferase family 1 protein [Pseudomonadota bacterium]
MQSTVRQRLPQTALRIAVVTETYPPEINGVARTVGLMVDALLARGHQVDLIRPRQSSDLGRTPARTLEGFTETLTIGLPIPKYPELQLGIARMQGLLKAWRRSRPDVVHLITEGPLGWCALRAARKLGIAVVSDFHTNFHDYSRHYGFGWIAGLVTGYLRALHTRTDQTFVPTHEMRDRLHALGFKDLSIVGRGIDTQLFSPQKRSAELRRSWQCENDTLVALYVGRLAAEKNLHLFVEAVRAARRSRPDLRVVIVGDGPMGKRLRAENPDFHFAGMRTGEDLAAYYASADLFVFPSLSETFGNVTMEALASGLAVVAFDYAAAREHIVHGHNGLVAAREDESAFCKQVLRLAGSKQDVHRLRQLARQTAERLSWGRVFDDLERSLLKFATPASDAATDCARAVAMD